MQLSTLQKGLVGHWKLDGNARDATPNANHGTVTEASLTTDRKAQSNKAYSFDGINDVITVSGTGAGAAVLRPTSITLSAWMKPTDTATGRIISRKTGGSPGSGYVLELTAALKPQIRIAGAAQDYTATTTDSIVQDSWSHVVATSDGTTMTLYINGVVNGTPTTPVANINYTVTTTDISIGGLATLEFFAGALDDVRIYNRALSTTEITALYNSYSPGVAISTLQKGLIVHLKTDGNARDASPYQNHGTVSNATLTTDRKGQANKAYSFNGTSARIRVNNSASLSMSTWTEFSIAFWIYTAGSTDNDRYINKIIATPFRGFNIDNQDPAVVGALRFEVFDATGSLDSSNDTNVIDVNTWTHVVATFKTNTATSGQQFYKNGVLKKQEGTTITTIGDNSGAALDIMSQGTANYAAGMLDDVRIYNRQLSATEIAALYNEYSPAIAVSTLQSKLLGHWKLDNTTRDATPNASHLTNNAGVTFTTDRKGQTAKAAQFVRASSQYLSITDNTALSTGDIDFTVSGWVYLDSKPAESMVIAGKWVSTGNQREYFLLWDTGDVFQFGVSNDGTAAVTRNATTFGAPALATWYFVVAWHDASANTVNIQVNNGTVDTTAHTTGVFDSTAYFGIGRRSTEMHWDGRIDDVRFYKKVLTTAERTALYESYK